MNPRLARFLARLYPPKWRARFGAEFQTFLESRPALAREVCDVIGRAMVEHIKEDWRYVPMMAVLTFAALGSAYAASGHSLLSPMEENGAVRLVWIALEAGSLAFAAFVLCAVSRGVYRVMHGEIRDLMLRVILPLVFVPACAVAAFQVLPWKLTSAPLAALTAVLAGLGGIGVLAGIFAAAKRLVKDLEISAQGKLEVFRLATSILAVSVIAAQFGFAARALSGTFGDNAYLASLGAIVGCCWGEAKRSGSEFKIS